MLPKFQVEKFWYSAIFSAQSSPIFLYLSWSVWLARFIDDIPVMKIRAGSEMRLIPCVLCFDDSSAAFACIVHRNSGNLCISI